MKKLTHIPMVTEKQAKFAAKLGLQLKGCSVRVGSAQIEDILDVEFTGVPLGNPTTKQIEFAAKFGHDISCVSRRVGDAIIGDLMEQLNHKAIQDEGLAPGVEVRNVYDTIDATYIISSISADGTVYFRGGNGKRSWARSLRNIENK